ncbi:MAG: hypothetical protein CM1200mP29_14590 [Verrucomicrobiota bacterium]|nr:MAG: hypothetical protein CM1200mP29_14590 [Verrucomicrobiota bacterium]
MGGKRCSRPGIAPACLEMAPWPQPTEQGFDVEVDHTKLPGFRAISDRRPIPRRCPVRSDDQIHRGQPGKPWCAYLSHFAVHTPIQAKREIIGKYEANARVTASRCKDGRDDSVGDEGVGKIIAKLEQLSQRTIR